MSHMKSFLGKLFRQVTWESFFTLAEIAFGKYFPKKKYFPKQLSETKKVLSETTFQNEKVSWESDFYHLKSRIIA